jgi:hypothetical protein
MLGPLIGNYEYILAMDSYGIMLTSAGDVASLIQERLSWAIAILSMVGLAVSGYPTWSDFAISGEVCPTNGFFECSLVTSSAYSRIRGMPIASLGAFWFLVALMVAVRVVSKKSWFEFQLAWSVLGTAGVLGLLYVELFLRGSVCALCTLVHSIGIAILTLTLAMWSGGRPQQLGG